MAQKITRTITSTLVTIKAIDAEKEEMVNRSYTLAGKIEDEAKVNKLVKKEAEKDGLVFIKVIQTDYLDAVYEMPIEVFIANATVVTE